MIFVTFRCDHSSSRIDIYVISKFEKICGFWLKFSQDFIFLYMYLDVVLPKMDRYDSGSMHDLSQFIMIDCCKQLFLAWNQLFFSNFQMEIWSIRKTCFSQNYHVINHKNISKLVHFLEKVQFRPKISDILFKTF